MASSVKPRGLAKVTYIGVAASPSPPCTPQGLPSSGSASGPCYSKQDGGAAPSVFLGWRAPKPCAQVANDSVGKNW